MPKPNYADIDTLARAMYREEGYETTTEKVFALLVDVADRYLALLEVEAGDDPAPFFVGVTPLTCLVNGLVENLDIRRGDRHR